MKRFTDSLSVDPSILGEHLKFNCGKVAPNRFLKAALSEKLSSFDPINPAKHGLPSQEMLNLYDKWGNGGFGVIFTGNVIVDPTHLETIGNAIIFEEGNGSERRELFNHLAKNMKQTGSLAVLQLSHCGRQTPVLLNPKPFSASAMVPEDQKFGEPVALTVEQIKSEVVDRFVYAAKFAVGSGFDGIELHAAHGYLLAQFTSPSTNKRTDHYGGSLENRLRIILEIYDAIRKEVPKDFMIGIKTNSVEFQAEGTTINDAIEMCRMFEAKGFDFVELSGGTFDKSTIEYIRESTKKREAFFVEFAEKIRPVFQNTIVYLTGGFRNVKAMVEAVECNATQGIGLGRSITAEPDLPKKILASQVGSAVSNLLGEDNFIITALASGVQMEQMSRITFRESNNDVMANISDFTQPETVGRFMQAVQGYVKYVGEQMRKGEKVDNLKFD